MATEAITITDFKRAMQLTHGQIDGLGPFRRERWAGDNSNDQTRRLIAPVSQIWEVMIYDNAASAQVEFKTLNKVATLTGTQDYTFANNVITFGNGTVGAKPNADAILECIYSVKDWYEQTYSLTWNGAVTTGDNKVPDTDTAMDFRGADWVYVQTTTPTVAGGAAATFDFSLIFSYDGTTFATDDRHDLDTGVAENVKQFNVVNSVEPYAKARLDVNTTATGVGENVLIFIVVHRNLKG